MSLNIQFQHILHQFTDIKVLSVAWYISFHLLVNQWQNKVFVPSWRSCGCYLKERNESRFCLRDGEEESLVQPSFASPDCAGFLTVFPELYVTSPPATSGGLWQ